MGRAIFEEYPLECRAMLQVQLDYEQSGVHAIVPAKPV